MSRFRSGLTGGAAGSAPRARRRPRAGRAASRPKRNLPNQGSGPRLQAKGRAKARAGARAPKAAASFSATQSIIGAACPPPARANAQKFDHRRFADLEFRAQTVIKRPPHTDGLPGFGFHRMPRARESRLELPGTTIVGPPLGRRSR